MNLTRLREELTEDLKIWEALAEEAPPLSDYEGTSYVHSKVDERKAQIQAIDDIQAGRDTEVNPDNHPWW